MMWRSSTVFEPSGGPTWASPPVSATRIHTHRRASAAPLRCSKSLESAQIITASVERDASSSRSQQQSSSSDGDEVWDYAAPQHVLERNTLFIDQKLLGRVILAPLTKGGNLPFRCGWCRLASDWTRNKQNVLLHSSSNPVTATVCNTFSSPYCICHSSCNVCQ
jgi:hypothetical protein